MSAVEYTSLVLSGIIILRAVINFYNLSCSLRWLGARDSYNSIPTTKFYVCIPALDEQDTVVETIETFMNQSYPAGLISVYIVTTSKEEKLPGKPSTKDVIDEYLSHQSDTVKRRVHVVNYPKTDGRMAHQINYLADRLRAELSHEDAYFVVYNADSHIHQDTLGLTDSIISEQLMRGRDRPTILQQSAVYQYFGKSYIAEGAGLHQTLWTLTHEIPKLLNQSSKVLKITRSNIAQILRYSRIAHCVGHGLFVRGDYYNRHHLPQSILNEDLPYGLQACALHEPIYPIPSLELASTPARIMSVYRQKSTWFNPFFEFINYGKELVHQKLYVSKLEVFWLLLQAYLSLFIWLIHSIVLTGGLAMSIFAGWQYIIVWIVALFTYWVIPASIVTHKRRYLANGGSNSYLSISAGMPYVLTHSVGPFIATYNWLIASIRGVKPVKRKTDAI